MVSIPDMSTSATQTYLDANPDVDSWAQTCVAEGTFKSYEEAATYHSATYGNTEGRGGLTSTATAYAGVDGNVDVSATASTGYLAANPDVSTWASAEVAKGTFGSVEEAAEYHISNKGASENRPGLPGFYDITANAVVSDTAETFFLSQTNSVYILALKAVADGVYDTLDDAAENYLANGTFTKPDDIYSLTYNNGGEGGNGGGGEGGSSGSSGSSGTGSGSGGTGAGAC